MRCSMCGHESPAGSSFCLNCGSSLAQTPPQQPGLPSASVCAVCHGENPPGMKFCRSCGSALAPTSVVLPPFGGPVGRPGLTPMPLAMPAPLAPQGPHHGGPIQGMPVMQGVPSGPLGGFPAAPVGGVPVYGPLGGSPGMSLEPEPTVPPTLSPSPFALGMMPTSLAAPAPVIRPQSPPTGPQPGQQASTVGCPRCGTQTPLGFAYCQQCGLHMQAAAPAPAPPAEAVAGARLRGPSAPPPIGGALRLDAPIDPHAGTARAGRQDRAAWRARPDDPRRLRAAASRPELGHRRAREPRRQRRPALPADIGGDVR